MKKQHTCGAASVTFEDPVFIQSCASVVSQKEGEGPLGSCFDVIGKDPMFGADTWESAEKSSRTRD